MPTNTKNAPGGGVTAPHATEGVQSTTNAQKEIVMTNDTPRRPWLDEATATHLTESDLARLDDQFARWPEDHAASLGINLVEYLRDCATDAAKIRMIIDTDEIPLPNFATIHSVSEWELDEHETDAFRTVTGEFIDAGSLNATFEADQYATSGRLVPRVYIEEGGTEDPAELAKWAQGLFALANRWRETHGEVR